MPAAIRNERASATISCLSAACILCLRLVVIVTSPSRPQARRATAKMSCSLLRSRPAVHDSFDFIDLVGRSLSALEGSLPNRPHAIFERFPRFALALAFRLGEGNVTQTFLTFGNF